MMTRICFQNSLSLSLSLALAAVSMHVNSMRRHTGIVLISQLGFLQHAHHGSCDVAVFILFFQIEDPFRCSQLGLDVLVE
jgi:hypothetical protein